MSTESVRRGNSMLRGTALFWVKIKFNLDHALAMGQISHVTSTLLIGCDPKFTCIFL